MSEEKRYLQLNDIEAYKISFHLSNYVWELINEWEWFSKRTIGIQFVNAIDSISANISEGFGRYFKKDKINFYRYAYGSTKECMDWNAKSKARKLITEKEYDYIFSVLKDLPVKINSLIKYTNEKLDK